MTRVNYAMNSCTGWDSAAIAATRGTKSATASAIRLTITDATATAFAQRIAPTSAYFVQASPGQVWSLSAFMAKSAGTGTMGVRILFLDSVGATISSVDGTPVAHSGSSTALPAASGTAPALTTHVTWWVGIAGTGTRTIGDTFDVKNVLFEQAATLGAFFDGDTTDTALLEYGWYGEARLSAAVESTVIAVGSPVSYELTVGRFGMDVQVASVSGWDESGSRVTITGQTPYGDVSESLALRQQLNGLVDSPDESFVPVTWVDQPEVDGYYRVLNVSVTPHQSGAFAGVYLFSIDLERVQGFAAPLIESVVVGALRSSALGLTARPWICIPSASRSRSNFDVIARTYGASPIGVVRTGELSSSVYYLLDPGASVQSFYVPPASFYDASSMLRVGDPLRVATGRQVSNLPAEWELSNDVMQVRPMVGTDFGIEFRTWTLLGWSPWESVALYTGTLSPIAGSPLPAPHAVLVNANSPEVVSIRFQTTTNTDTRSPLTIDLTLRRGGRHVAVEVHSVQSRAFAVVVSNFASPTAATGGLWKNNNGIRTFIGSPVALVVPIAAVPTGYGPATTVVAYSFCFGLIPGNEIVQDNLDEYFWAGNEKQTVVAR